MNWRWVIKEKVVGESIDSGKDNWFFEDDNLIGIKKDIFDKQLSR